MWRLGDECEDSGHSAGTEDKPCQTDEDLLRKVHECKEHQKRPAKEKQGCTSYQKKQNKVYEGDNITGITLSSNRKESQQYRSEPTVISALESNQTIIMLSSDSSEKVSEIRIGDNSSEPVTLAIMQHKQLETQIKEEHPLKQSYKVEVCLSPQQLQLANNMHGFSPRGIARVKKASNFGAGGRKDNQKKTTPPRTTGMPSATQIYKSASSFYPKIVGSGKQKVTAPFVNNSEAEFSTTISNKQLPLTSECKKQSTKSIILTQSLAAKPREERLQRAVRTTTEVQAKETFHGLGAEIQSDQANVVEFEPSQLDPQGLKLLRESDTNVMPAIPKYEVIISPTSKKILAASYSGSGISTRHGFDRLLEQGYDVEPFIFQNHQSKKFIEQKEQEKEIPRAHLQYRVVEAMCRDANNNIIVEKALEKPFTEVNQRNESPRLEDTAYRTDTNLRVEKQEQAPLVPQNVAMTSLHVVGGTGVHSRSEIPKTQFKQVSQKKPDTATTNVYKAETKFCPSKSVATKVEAKQVIQKNLNKAMKNLFKSETKVNPKKVQKEEKLPRNLQKLEKRDSAKYELMLDDIKKANTEIYQSAPLASFSHEEDDTVENNLSLKETRVVLNASLTPGSGQNDRYTEELKAEIRTPEGIKEESTLPSRRNYKSETKVVPKTSRLKRSSIPDHGPRLSWKDDGSICGVFKSEVHLAPNLGKKDSQQLDSPRSPQADFPSSNKQEKRKGSSKTYKISVATVQKTRRADKKGKPHPSTEDNRFSYKLNTCYKLSRNQLQNHEKNRDGEFGSQGTEANVAVNENPEWTTTISFEQNRE